MADQKYPLQSPKFMPTNVLTLLLLLASVCSPANAADQDLGAPLTTRYRGQILPLRHSFSARYQEYDSHGNFLAGGSEGPWTLFGRIDVKKISVAADYLQVEGNQVIFASSKKETLKPKREDAKVMIAIRLEHPLASEDEAIAVMGRVFALTSQEVVNSAPGLWRNYLVKQLNVSQESAKKDQHNDGNQGKPANQTGTLIDINGPLAGQTVYLLGKEIVAPKPEYTPEPEYSSFAKKRGLQGVSTFDVVVGSDGKVHGVSIVRPLGLGLDEQAAAAISGWKFTPAMRDGQPVACAFYIEVDFHLY